MSGGEVHDLARRALALAVERKTTEGAHMLSLALGDSDVEQVFTMCCGFAESGRVAMVAMAKEHAPIFANGESWGITELQPGAAEDPAAVFSVRFLVAWANGEKDTARALYDGLLSTGEAAAIVGVGRLFGDIAKLIRTAGEGGQLG